MRQLRADSGAGQRVRRLRRRGLAGLLLAVLLLAPLSAAAEPPPQREGWRRAERAGRVGFDLVILRPLQLAQVISSAAIFLPSYPISFLFEGDEDVLDALITEPTDRLFRRSLGDL